MTVTHLLADLACRGIRLALAAGGIAYEAPPGALTAADRAAIAECRSELLDLLRAEAEELPDGPCGLCGSPLTWVENWPTTGHSLWVCLTCADRPAPSLAAVDASLTPDERQRFVDEARAGDALGRLLLKLVPPAGMA